MPMGSSGPAARNPTEHERLIARGACAYLAFHSFMALPSAAVGRGEKRLVFVETPEKAEGAAASGLSVDGGHRIVQRHQEHRRDGRRGGADHVIPFLATRRVHDRCEAGELA